MNLIPDKTAILKTADATLGSLICRMAGHLLSWRQHHDIRPKIPVANLRRILVIRPGGMGDMIVLLPLLRFLRSKCPGAYIDVVCERRNVAVLDMSGLSEQAFVYDTNPWAFLIRLRSQRYDLAIDTEQFHHFSAVFALLSGAPFRIGFKLNPIRNPLYTHLVSYDVDGSEREQFARLLQPLEIDGAPPPLEGILCSEVDASAVATLNIPHFSSGQSVICIHPGSSVRCKQWHEENFVSVATRLHKKIGCRIVLVGSRSEAGSARRIEAFLRAKNVPCLNAIGFHSLAKTAAIMRCSNLFLGGDSGLAHLAVALNIPSVVLFGPSDHRKWGTQTETHLVVSESLPCSPCFLFGYNRPCRSVACMRRISVERVEEACMRLMGKNPSLAPTRA